MYTKFYPLLFWDWIMEYLFGCLALGPWLPFNSQGSEVQGSPPRVHEHCLGLSEVVRCFSRPAVNMGTTATNVRKSRYSTVGR